MRIIEGFDTDSRNVYMYGPWRRSSVCIDLPASTASKFDPSRSDRSRVLCPLIVSVDRETVQREAPETLCALERTDNKTKKTGRCQLGNMETWKHGKGIWFMGNMGIWETAWFDTWKTRFTGNMARRTWETSCSKDVSPGTVSKSVPGVN